MITRQTLLFMDAAALFVAAKTPTGGSAYILKVSQGGFLHVCSSPAALDQTEHNLLAKVSFAAVMVHRSQVANTPIRLTSVPMPSVVAPLTGEFGTDDHIVASALSSKSDFIITLDLRLIRKLKAHNYPIIPVTPKEFLEDHFPSHPDYGLIRALIV
jgi:hypothetical protein